MHSVFFHLLHLAALWDIRRQIVRIVSIVGRLWLPLHGTLHDDRDVLITSFDHSVEDDLIVADHALLLDCVQVLAESAVNE